MDILYGESAVNYNWTNIMKTVKQDPIGFYEMGGWSYLQPGNVSLYFNISRNRMTMYLKVRVNMKKMMTMRMKMFPRSMKKTKVNLNNRQKKKMMMKALIGMN